MIDNMKNNAIYYRTNNEKSKASKSFEYTPKLIGSTPDDNNTLGTEIVVLREYLCNFGYFLI